jgi:hypothetical protein
VQALVQDVLAAWREADRLAATCDPASPDQIAALNAAARLRQLYSQVTKGEERDADVPTLRALLDEIRSQVADPGRVSP